MTRPLRPAISLLLALAACLPLSRPERDPPPLRFPPRVRSSSAPANSALGSLAGCGQTLVTGQPMHIAVGSLAPQNGTAFGLAFVEHTDLQSRWRLNYNLDAVASRQRLLARRRLPQSLPPARRRSPSSSTPATPPRLKQDPSTHVAPALQSLRRDHLAQPHLLLRPRSQHPAHRPHRLRPHRDHHRRQRHRPLRLKAGLGCAGRTQRPLPLRSRQPGQTTVPRHAAALHRIHRPRPHPPAGLLPGRRRPPPQSLPPPDDFLRLNYLLQFQQFVASADSHYYFRRWTVDLGHEIPLYRKVRLTAAQRPQRPRLLRHQLRLTSATPCPHVSLTQNLEGSISARLLISGSFAKAGSAVPFYFMPTIGGSDINGQPSSPATPTTASAPPTSSSSAAPSSTPSASSPSGSSSPSTKARSA